MLPPIFELEKPDQKKINFKKLVQVLASKTTQFRGILKMANQPYIYWDKFKHKVPAQALKELSAEELWLWVGRIREINFAETPIKTKSGNYFKWFKQPIMDELLHKIDLELGGQLVINTKINQKQQASFISRGVIEEAIASSQLEGAHTTRAAAKKIILEKRSPRNKSEQMIVNNYEAMTAIESEIKTKTLSKNLLFELHSILTYQTVPKDQQKRFRKDTDEIVVQGQIHGEEYVAHVPPPEKFLEEEIQRLIDFANDELPEPFLHPVIKAIMLHFWIGYLHPFTDGNGRLARALYYWYLLKKGYWAFTYIPISTIIKKSPTQYAMAYIYSEQCQDDLTYFIEYQLQKINQAMIEFADYVAAEQKQNNQIDLLINKKTHLNERQKQLLHFFISKPSATTTTSSYALLNKLSRQTAAKDLARLQSLGLIQPKRAGQFVEYFATEKWLKKTLSQNNG